MASMDMALAAPIITSELKTDSRFQLLDYLKTQPGGEPLGRFLAENSTVGQGFLVGSLAERAKQSANPLSLGYLQTWWDSHHDDYPYRKSGVADVDMPMLVPDESGLEWKMVDGVNVVAKEMKDGRTMYLAGVDVQPEGGHFARREGYLETTWAEVVPMELGAETVEEHFARLGYSRYTTIASLDENLGVNGFVDINWVGWGELARDSEPVNSGTLNEVLGKDTAFLKLAVKSLVNAGMNCGGTLPVDIRGDLVKLIGDRVELIVKDWQEYQESRSSFEVAHGLIGGSSLEDMTANNTYLFINVVERMIDGWVILGKEATDIYRESGLFDLIFSEQEEGNTMTSREKIIWRLNRAISCAPLKNLFPDQPKRLTQELVGLKVLFESLDLEI